MESKFNIVKKGYSKEEVDSYILKLENVIKSYKEKDAAIKNAIISSQIAADNIIANAEEEAKSIKRKTNRDLERILGSIEKQKNFVREFQDDYNNMVKRYLHEFNDKEVLKVYSKISELEEDIVSIKKGEDIDKDPQIAPLKLKIDNDYDIQNELDSNKLNREVKGYVSKRLINEDDFEVQDNNLDDDIKLTNNSISKEEFDLLSKS